MKNIEDKILRDGRIIDNDIIKVDSFLNHQIDVAFIREFAIDVKEFFAGKKIDRVLTIETSGVAIGYAVAEIFGDIPLVFAKKTKSKTVGTDVYHTAVKSFTRGATCDVTVAMHYLHEGENVLIVDDFLAEGNASMGLIDLCRQANANVSGVAVVIEKTFQGGRERIEKEGIPVFSLSSIKAFRENKPVF